MKKKYLPEGKMCPSIHLVRRYTAEKNNLIVTSSTERIVKGYETGIYLTDGGSITINGEKTLLKTNHIRFLREGDRVSSEPGYICDSIYFNFGKEGVFYENELLSSIPSLFIGNESIKFMFQRISEYATHDEVGSAAIMNGLLMQMIGSYYHVTHSKDNYSDVVKECLEYMKKRINQHVTLKELGEYTGYSSLHVLRLFKENTGRTPHAHLTNLRIAKAKDLLVEKNATMAFIASECGFESESHFQSLFKKQTGITPGKYRKYVRELN